jgi:hypothetical protein
LNNQLIHSLTNNKHQQQNRTNNKENNIEVEQTWSRVERRRNENGGRLKVERGRGAS